MAATFSHGPSPQVLLTAAHVEQWKAELVEAEAVVTALKRKLDAAAVFYPANGAAKQPAEVLSETVGDWVVRVLREAKKTLTPREIRMAIARENGPLGSENYLYTAIKRTAATGAIAKRGDGYVFVADGSPKGETGDHSAPSTFDKRELPFRAGAGETAPEAGGT